MLTVGPSRAGGSHRRRWREAAGRGRDGNARDGDRGLGGRAALCRRRMGMTGRALLYHHARRRRLRGRALAGRSRHRPAGDEPRPPGASRRRSSSAAEAEHGATRREAARTGGPAPRPLRPRASSRSQRARGERGRERQAGAGCERRVGGGVERSGGTGRGEPAQLPERGRGRVPRGRADRLRRSPPCRGRSAETRTRSRPRRGTATTTGVQSTISISPGANCRSTQRSSATTSGNAPKRLLPASESP